MKRFMRAVILVPLLFVVTTAFAGDRLFSEPWPPDRVDTNLLIQDDRFVPIPWSTQNPFPWDLIEGIWLAQNGDFESYYSFKVRKSRGKLKVEIRQVDVVTCRTVAVGAGIPSVHNHNTLTAYMAFLGYSQKYKILIRSYDYVSAKDISIIPVEGQVILLSILPEDRARYVHMALTKVTKDPRVSLCRPKNRKQEN